MSKVLYFLATFAESGLSVFGIRGTYAQPAYTVVQTLGPDIEIRRYGPRTVVQTPITDAGDGAAFGRLFRYITGANADGRTVPMTVPVEQSSGARRDVPGQQALGTTMRFYLPPDVAAKAPVPTEAGVSVEHLPGQVLGVVRFSGAATPALRSQETARLTDALRSAGRKIEGTPVELSYDPPFTLPFLRRNEVALEVSP